MNELPEKRNYPEVWHTLSQIFINRFDAFSEMQSDGTYLAVKEELTPVKFEQHLTGERTLGAYLINPTDQTTKILGFDLDTDPDDLNPAKTAAAVIYQALVDAGVPRESILVEFTGMKGYRPTVFFDPPVSAKLARLFAQMVIKELKLPDGVTLEIFPKQDAIKPNEFGNLTKLPFALHKKTGKRSCFVRPRILSQVAWNVILAVRPWAMPVEMGKKLEADMTLPKHGNEPLSHEDHYCWQKISTGDVPEGKRHYAAFMYAQHLRDQGLGLDATLAVLEKLWQRLVQHGERKMPWSEVRRGAELSYKRTYRVGCGAIRRQFGPEICDLNCPLQQRKKPYVFTKSSDTPTEKELAEMKKKLEGPPLSDDAKAKAMEILEHENPVEFVGKTIQLMHKGDDELGQYLWAGTLTPELGYKLHVLAVGSSGVGKSDLLRKVSRCIPKKYRIKLDSLSPKSIYAATKAGVSLEGAVFYVDDADPADEEQIKTLKMMATDDPDAMRHWSLDDSRNFESFEVPRNFVVFASSIQSLTDKQGQFLRRYEILNPSEEETTLIAALAHIKDDIRAGKAEETYPEEFEVAQAITAEIKSKRFRVIIPFLYEFPQTGFETKTASKKFGALVWAIAKSFFKQRIVVNNTVIAQPEDFELAVKLWAKRQPMKVDAIAMAVLRALGDVEPVESVLTEDHVTTRTWNPEPVTSTTLAKTLKYAPRTIRDKLENLYDMGFADRKGVRGRGNPYAYWRSPRTSEKIGNLDKQSEGLGLFIISPNSLPSFDQTKLISTSNDYLHNSTYVQQTQLNSVWEDYKTRLSCYLIRSAESANNTPTEETGESGESEAVPTAFAPKAQEKPPVLELGGIPLMSNDQTEKALSILAKLADDEGSTIKYARYLALCLEAGVDERMALEVLNDLKRRGEVNFIDDNLFEVP